MAKTKYQLQLRGFVGGWDFDLDYVAYVLQKNDGKRVDVLIDSLGGRVDTALSIAAAFRNHGDVHVHFVGMNASAATIASLGAKEITMDKYAMYLAHKCSIEFFQWCQANSDQLEEMIRDLEHQKEDLDKVDSNIATMYADRTGKSYDEVIALMSKGSWLTSSEAKKFGLVDSLTEDEDDEPVEITDSLASRMVAHGIPLPGNYEQPHDDQSMFSKFLNALTKFFKSNNKPAETMDNQEQIIQAVEEQVEQTAAQEESQESAEPATAEPATAEPDESSSSPEPATLDDHSAELEALRSENEQLRAQIAELSRAPGDVTAQVVETATEGNAFDGYLNTVNSARKLYNMVKGIK